MANAVNYSKYFDAQELTVTTEVDLFTLALNPSTGVIKNLSIMVVVNGTGSNLEAWIIPNGGSSGDSNVFIPNEAFSAARTIVTMPDMKAGDKLTVKAGTANELTIHPVGGLTLTS